MTSNTYREFYRTGSRTFPVLSGNGELVTAFGPTGFHTDSPTPQMQVFVLAGRRIKAPTAPLVRFGQLKRTLVLDGKASAASNCKQELVPDEGIVLSSGKHEGLTEDTVSFVCLGSNAAAFRTALTNTARRNVTGEFVLEYRFGDWEGSLQPDTHLYTRPIKHPNGAAMRFEVDRTHAGAVELLCSRLVQIEQGAQGFVFRWAFELQAGQEGSIDFLFGIGDKRKFRYIPDQWSFDDLLRQQKQGWGEFINSATVEFGQPQMEALHQMCLYSIRCNSTDWSVPPSLSPAQWEGRTFHDELYPFLGLASAGHIDLAKKIPYYRLRTLPKAVARANFRGAKYPWESLEDGEDGSPYGHWLEEHFHMGQFVETAWQLCLYDGSSGLRQEFYPLLREIADYYVLNVIESDGDLAWIKPCTDYDEAISPVENGLYTACAAVRSLELAALVGGELDESDDRIAAWKQAAQKLRRNLPISEEENRYSSAAGAAHRHIAEVGPVFPFRIDAGSDRARGTMDSFCEAVRTHAGLQPGNLPEYGGSRWLWTAAHVSSAYQILGEPDKAFELLKEAPAAAGPGLTPAERIMPDGAVRLPFFTTGAGAFVFSVHNLFVQVTDDGATKLPALPEEIRDAQYEGLAGAHGTRYSAAIANGRIVSLTIGSERSQSIVLLVDKTLVSDGITRWQALDQWGDEGGFYSLTVALETGTTCWRSEA